MNPYKTKSVHNTVLNNTLDASGIYFYGGNTATPYSIDSQGTNWGGDLSNSAIDHNIFFRGLSQVNTAEQSGNDVSAASSHVVREANAWAGLSGRQFGQPDYRPTASALAGAGAYVYGAAAWAYGAAPLAPIGLTPIVISGAVVLNWVDQSNNATNYYVLRGTASGVESLIAVGTAGDGAPVTFTDDTAAGGTTYYYEVILADAGGYSPWSEVSIATP